MEDEKRLPPEEEIEPQEEAVTQEEDLPPQEEISVEEDALEEEPPKKKKFHLPRFLKRQPPKMTRSAAWILAVITLVYATLAFFRIGTTDIPQTTLYMEKSGQNVTFELEEAQEVSRFCLYKWGGRKNDITIETWSEETETWSLAYGPSELSSHMRWKTLDLETDGPVKRVRLTFEGRRITLAEVCILDENDQPVAISAPERLNKHLTEKDKLDHLTDEQELLDADSATLTYAYFDEYLYALTSYSYLHGGTGSENTHPPLGKVFMEIGIAIFGMNPFGWRLMGTISGILMLPVMFFLARRVLGSNKWALVATFLMSVESMHYSQTRLATIDSFPLLFILSAYLFMLKFYQDDMEREKKNLLWSGIFFGLACACKWIGAYAGVGLAICFFAFFADKARGYKEENPDFSVWKYMLTTFGTCVVFFVIFPVAIYVMSYFPAAFGPYDDIQGWKGIWENQVYMWEFHKDLEQTFTFSSKWWGWSLLIGGFSSYFGTSLSGMESRIICTGNPVIWWVSIPAILAIFWYFVMGRKVAMPLIIEPKRKKNKKNRYDLLSGEEVVLCPVDKHVWIHPYDSGLFLVLVAYLCQYVPWIIITRECFIYHYFASAEISILAITYLLKRISDKFRFGRVLTGVYMGTCTAVFAFMFPILNGYFIDPAYMDLLKDLFL